MYGEKAVGWITGERESGVLPKVCKLSPVRALVSDPFSGKMSPVLGRET